MHATCVGSCDMYASGRKLQLPLRICCLPDLRRPFNSSQFRSHASRDSWFSRSSSLAMFRPASRALLRTTRAPCTGAVVAGPASRRLVSTAAPETGKSRSWKNTALRLGLATGAVYYYNTSDILSNEENCTSQSEQNTHRVRRGGVL